MPNSTGTSRPSVHLSSWKLREAFAEMALSKCNPAATALRFASQLTHLSLISLCPSYFCLPLHVFGRKGESFGSQTRQILTFLSL